MINKIIKFIKAIFIAILVLVGILFATLSLLNNKEFVISTSILQKIVNHYDQNLIVEPIDAKIGINKYKIIVSIDQIKLHKANNKDIVLSNVNAIIKPFQAEGQINLQIKDVPLNHFIQLHENPKLTVFIDNFFHHNHLVCSGNVILNFSLFKSHTEEVNIYSNDGWHDPKVENLKKLQLKQFDFSLHCENDKISITKLNLSYVDSFQLSLTGDFSFSDDEFLLAEFQTDLSMFPVDYLAGFWPPQNFPDAQNWVTNNIKKGIVKQAKAAFKFSDEDLNAPSLPKESMNVLMDLAGMEVNYLSGYSPITQVNGNFKIDGAGIYLDNATGFMGNNKLENIKLDLPFENCVLRLKTNVEGEISSFKQFIPNVVNDKLKKFDIEYALIKGRAKANIALEIPILEQFQVHTMLLDIKASLENVILDKKGLFKFSQGNLIINNDKNGIKVELLSKDIIFVQFESAYGSDNVNDDKVYFNVDITTKDNFTIFDKISIKGNFKAQYNLNNKNWQANLNLDKAEITLLPISYIKANGVPSNLECSGEVTDDKIIAKACNISGKDISGDGNFTYSKKNDAILDVALDNMKIGPSDFSMKAVYDKNIFYYKLKAKYIDLSGFSMDDFSFSSKNKSNYNIDLRIDQMVVADKNKLHDIQAKIVQNNSSPIEIDLKVFNQNKKLTITKITKNNQIGYLLYSDDAGTFSQDFGIYKKIKKGELWLEMYPKKEKNNVSYHGTLKLSSFFFTNTSALTKIILGVSSALNSPEALARALQGGSLRADLFEADVTYDQGVISLNNGEIEGPSYEVKLKGYMDINNSKLDFRGVYIPSVFGINKLVSGIPIVGPLISGGKNSALIGANFSITGSTKDPDVFFNPLSVLTPGFLRNLF